MKTRLWPVGYGLRSRRKVPGFSTSVVLALVVGLGLGIPSLGIVHAGLLRSSLYTDPLLRDGGTAEDWLPGWTATRQTIPGIQTEALQSLLWVLLVLAVLLLAIALINILILVLSRAAVRRSEIALRAALGAVRRRLMGQLLVEAAPLLLLGAGLGIATAVVVACALHASWPGEAPPWGSSMVDSRVLAGAVGVFLLASLLVWLSPVSVAWHTDLRRFLTGRQVTASRGEILTRQMLAVVQVAASLVLLTTSGLLLRGFASSPEESRKPGFHPGDTLAMQLHLPQSLGLSLREQSLLHERVRHGIATLPGVVDSSVATPGTWVGLGTSDLVHALTGMPTAPGWVKPARYLAVSPGFFRTLGIPVIHGREFGASDVADAPRVAIVNPAFVNQFRLVGNGVGRDLQLQGMSLDGPWYTIVGVVEDIRTEGLGSGSEPVPKVYLSTLQHPPSIASVAVRTTGDPMQLLPAVADVVHVLAPGAELSDAMTMEQYLARFRAPLRWFAAVFAVLAGFALLLATSGLHGVMSYNVTRRTREIGIRMALGARVETVTRMIIMQGLHLVGIGAILGLMGALSLARMLQLVLSGVEPFDPLLFGGIALLLGSVVLLSSYRPAQRAASVDPQISLRAE